MNRRAFFFSLILAVATACGDDSVSDKWSEACEATRPAMERAEGCPPDTDVAGLTSFCKVMGSGLLDTDDCREKLDAYTECIKQYEYSCGTGGNVPMATNREVCESEAADFTFGNEPGACVNPDTVQSSGG